MALQYLDYCEDNQQRGFHSTLDLMRGHRSQSLGFGAGVMLAAMVPVLNWFVMPVAVCGAVRLWAGLRQMAAGSQTRTDLLR
jgi:CysZ protein